MVWGSNSPAASADAVSTLSVDAEAAGSASFSMVAEEEELFEASGAALFWPQPMSEPAKIAETRIAEITLFFMC